MPKDKKQNPGFVANNLARLKKESTSRIEDQLAKFKENLKHHENDLELGSHREFLKTWIGYYQAELASRIGARGARKTTKRNSPDERKHGKISNRRAGN